MNTYAHRPAAPGPAPSFGEPGLLGEAPALYDSEWLPAGANAELDELRAEHQRIIAAAREAGAALAAAERRYEEEDAAYTAAVSAQVVGNDVVLPERTDAQVRAQELKDVRERNMALLRVREEFAGRAITTIQGRYDAWTADLDDVDAQVAERIEAARRALAEAEAEAGKTTQLRLWLARTAGRREGLNRMFGPDLPSRHIAYPDLAGVGRGLPIQRFQPDPDADADAAPEQPIHPDDRTDALAERAARFDITSQEATDE